MFWTIVKNLIRQTLLFNVFSLPICTQSSAIIQHLIKTIVLISNKSFFQKLRDLSRLGKLLLESTSSNHIYPSTRVKSKNQKPLDGTEGWGFVNLPFGYRALSTNSKMFIYDTRDALRDISWRTFGFGFYHIQGLVLVLAVDAMLTDDEPLWEPIEWSLVQSWILFIFSFAWIAENLIVSRFGSYTGRDKRVWFSWYKTFWLIEFWYLISYGAATVFVIVPFYFETNYNISFVFSWWHWYSRVFFFKFISLFTLVLIVAYVLQMSVRWLNWKKGLVLVLLINCFLGYLLYTHFLMTFFGYFTDPVWYQKTRPVDYIQLSHEPARWGWGGVKKDHFTYHNVRTVFWFKNDGPFAASFLMFHLFMWICMFLLFIYWVALFRRIYAMKEIPLTYTTYCVSALKQFLYFFLMMYIFILLSYMICYWRFPIEFLWTINCESWLTNFVGIVLDYPSFIFSIFVY